MTSKRASVGVLVRASLFTLPGGLHAADVRILPVECERVDDAAPLWTGTVGPYATTDELRAALKYVQRSAVEALEATWSDVAAGPVEVIESESRGPERGQS